MSVDVTASVRIEASPEAVAKIQFDPLRDPEWIGGVDRATWVGDPPMREGAEVLRSGTFLGRALEWLMHVEAYTPGRHIGMRSIRAPFPMQVDYRLEPSDGATQASIRVRGAGRGLYALPGVVLGPMVRRSVAGDLRRLKRLVEGAGR